MHRKYWVRGGLKKLLAVMVCMAVFCSVYAPVLSVMAADTCSLTEHIHTDGCYEAGSHAWLWCGGIDSDNVIHTHHDLCYTAENVLLCSLPEREEHTHEDSCYDPETQELVCDKEEVVLHQHGDECWYVSDAPNAYPMLVCGLPVVEQHVHEEACLRVETTQELACTLTEHTHSDNCQPAGNGGSVTEVEDENATLNLKVWAYSNNQVIPFSGGNNVSCTIGSTVTFVLRDTAGTYANHALNFNGCELVSVVHNCDQGTNVHKSGDWCSHNPVYTFTVCVTSENASVRGDIGWLYDGNNTYSVSGAQTPTPTPTPEHPEVTQEQQAAYEAFCAELDALLAQGLSEEARKAPAEELWERICEASNNGEISDAMYYELNAAMIPLRYGENHGVGESAHADNFPATMQQLREEIAYAESHMPTEPAPKPSFTFEELFAAADNTPMMFAARVISDNSQQILDRGGESESADGAVWVSKTIAPTTMENVFDITLEVITKEEVNEVYDEPDMAVVIVMDISNTMKDDFGDTSRYMAAISAAENFIQQFADNNKGASRLGFVAFNTSAHQIFALQSCSTDAQAAKLINTMKSETSAIITPESYASAHTRFTNIEGGLKRAWDMLNASDNQHKYIVFLSDGFPTTYLSSGYTGYDPYDSSGTRFYDSVEKYDNKNRPCSSGTSYSDIAAQKASAMAKQIKDAGGTIFSIGVDVNGQSVETYVNDFKGSSFSVVDRRTTDYEVYKNGEEPGLSKYETWLKKSIGSDYYYQSSDATGLANAFNSIFEEIKSMNASSAHLDWVVGDPMGNMGVHEMDAVEFLGFYNKDGDLVNTITDGVLTSELVGTSDVGDDYENTAKFDNTTNTIQWDLKNSRYQMVSYDNITLYRCWMTYRVRLRNEEAAFVEYEKYATNDTTSLAYRVIDVTDGVTTVSEQRTVEFPLPVVTGYVESLRFIKVDSGGSTLAGAEFTLAHDTASCGLCCGDGERSVAITNQIKTSGEDGVVEFTHVPSGHKYTLTETKVPEGHRLNGNTYTVDVAYDVLTVSVLDKNGETVVWEGKIENFTEYVLPQTGGPGTQMYYIGGLLLTAATLIYGYTTRRSKRKGGEW